MEFRDDALKVMMEKLNEIRQGPQDKKRQAGESKDQDGIFKMQGDIRIPNVAT